MCLESSWKRENKTSHFSQMMGLAVIENVGMDLISISTDNSPKGPRILERRCDRGSRAERGISFT